MKIAFTVDGTLIVVLSAAGLVGLFALHAAYPRLYDYWPKTSADLASWMQAVGAVAAILGAVWIANRQERLLRYRSKQIAIRRARSALAGLETTAESVFAHASCNKADMVQMRMFAEEYLQVARSVEAEVLSVDWIAQIYGMRAAGVRLLAALQAFDGSPARAGHSGIVEASYALALQQEAGEVASNLSAISAVLLAQHPGVCANEL